MSAHQVRPLANNWRAAFPHVLAALAIGVMTVVAFVYAHELCLLVDAQPHLARATCPDGNWVLHFTDYPDVVTTNACPVGTVVDY